MEQNPTPDGTPPTQPDAVREALKALLEADTRFQQAVARTDDLPPLHCRNRDDWVPHIMDMIAELDVVDATLGKLIAALEAEEAALSADGREQLPPANDAPTVAESDADAVRRKIEIGLRQCETGQTLTNDEATKKLGKWLNPDSTSEEPKP